MRTYTAMLIAFGSLLVVSCGQTQPLSSDARSPGIVPADGQGGSAGHVHGEPETESEHSHKHGQAHAPHGGSHAGELETNVPGSGDGIHRHASHDHASHDHAIAAQAIENDAKIAIGDTVPDFDVTIDGEPWKLSELRKNTEITEDGTLVLTFWCSFCHSCRHVERSLDRLAKEYQGKVGVIALDASAGETTEGVAEFAKEHELTMPIALDTLGAAADIFGVRATTTTVVIDKTGVLRYRGRFSDEQRTFAQDALRAVLAEADVPVQETLQKG